MRTFAAAIVILTIAFLIAVAFAAPTSRLCIALDLTLYTYDGPLVIDGACVDSMQYTSTALRVVAHDAGDGIFRNGFEVAP